MRGDPPPAGDVTEHESGSPGLVVGSQAAQGRLHGLPVLLEDLGERPGRDGLVAHEQHGLEGPPDVLVLSHRVLPSRCPVQSLARPDLDAT